MVSCNLCLKNKPIEEIQLPFRYICKECWNKLKIIKDNKEIDKEVIY